MMTSGGEGAGAEWHLATHRWRLLAKGRALHDVFVGNDEHRWQNPARPLKTMLQKFVSPVVALTAHVWYSDSVDLGEHSAWFSATRETRLHSPEAALKAHIGACVSHSAAVRNSPHLFRTKQ